MTALNGTDKSLSTDVRIEGIFFDRGLHHLTLQPTSFKYISIKDTFSSVSIIFALICLKSNINIANNHLLPRLELLTVAGNVRLPGEKHFPQ